MIVPRGVVAPLALLVALLTATVAMYAGIGRASEDFWGQGDLVVVGPLGDVLPGKGTLDAAFADHVVNLPGVHNVSVEVFALTGIQGHSAFVRGANATLFLRFEGATLVEGRLPAAPDEALAGRAFAASFGLRVNDSLVVPGMLAHVGVPVKLVGVYDTPGPARDHLLVSLDAGRAIAGVGDGAGHVIRVEADDAEAVRRFVDSPTPVFSYDHVNISAAKLVPGQRVHVVGNLTNWGRESGTKLAEVRAGGEVVARHAYDLQARQTVRVDLEFVLEKPGATQIQINPTFAVDVREPRAALTLPPSVLVGDSFVVTARDIDGNPLPDLDVSFGARANRSGADGNVTFVADTLGDFDVVASRGGEPYAVAPLHVGSVDEEGPRVPLGRVESIRERSDLHVENESFVVDVGVANRGAEGNVTPDLRLDGEPLDLPTLHLGAGGTRDLAVTIPPLEPGRHKLVADQGRVQLDFKVYSRATAHGDWLRDHAEAGAQAVAPQAASDYFSQVLGNVSLAIFLLSLASGGLAAAGAAAVLARHLGERVRSVGTLQALGATRQQVLAQASREAARWGALAAAIGLGAGILLARAIELTGLVRAFGHEVHPVFPWYLLALLFVVAVDYFVVVTRVLVRALSRVPTATLLRGRVVAGANDVEKVT